MLLTFSFWFCCMYFVDDNKFEGSIPSELGLLTKLWTLNVGMYEEIIKLLLSIESKWLSI